MTALSEVNVVLKSLLALILTRSVIPFTQRIWIQKFGLFIVKIAVVLALGGFAGHVHQYIEGQKALQIAQDPTARMDDDDDEFCTAEKISLLKEERKDGKEENCFLLDGINDRNNCNEADLMRTEELMEEKHNSEKPGRERDLAEQENQRLKKKIEELEEAMIQKAKEVENLNDQLAAKEEECDRNRKELDELRTQAVDNDFYCGYLEDKVKTHEAERKRRIEATTELDERLPASEREVSVLAINPDLERNQDNEAQKSLGPQKKVHALKETVQPVQQENEKRKKKKKLSKRACKETVINNSMSSEKHKNIDLMEETKRIGNVFCKLGHLEQAGECFLRVMHMDDDQVDCRIKLGLCLLLLGRHGEAVVQLEELKDREDLVAVAKTLQRMQRHGCPYYVLGVPEDATSKEIEWAYRKRALKFNPDRCRGSNEERERLKEIMQKINFANDLLCDADERREYDAVRESIRDLADKAFQDTQFPRQ
ncbi:myosin heavy chain, cardiac muscle isoform-like [Macrobrachium rosenbergii]|uniref:myosin heavy chain, cardiac muscle isoform-like n=1 Tax=Macrobrachium rosenbergii TaxID=79674 RepID=UPI0034D5240B